MCDMDSGQRLWSNVISSAGEDIGVSMSNGGDKVDTFNKDQSHRKSQRTGVLVEEWGMGCQSDNNRNNIGHFCVKNSRKINLIGQQRAIERARYCTERKDCISTYFGDNFYRSQFVLFRFLWTILFNFIIARIWICVQFRLQYVLVCFLLLSRIVNGDTVPVGCHMKKCADTFSRDSQMKRVEFSANLENCILLTNYAECFNRTARSCRGHLRFHSLLSMVNSSLKDFNCLKLVQDQQKTDEREKNGADTNSKISPPTSPFTPYNGGDVSTKKCTFPYHHQKGASGYRYCSAFGDPHLRTFEGQYETCKTLGAWPLVDNAYVNVQLMNEIVSDGGDISASVITKISVIIKAKAGCTEQKTYTATKDALPSAFDDGTINNGNVDAASRYHYESTLSSVGGAPNPYSGAPARGSTPPALYLQTLARDQHVEIHLRYVASRIVIRRSSDNGHLSVAVKMPEDALDQEASFSTWQLCMAGCPAAEKINYKEILSSPDYYLKRMVVTRDVAVEKCSTAGVTDFFFDSCVFDLLITGQSSFVESARHALDDIRQMYPPYVRHYETNRTDLRLYDELARLARDKENFNAENNNGNYPVSSSEDETHRRNNNRRYSSTKNAASTSPNSVFGLFSLLIWFFLISIR